MTGPAPEYGDQKYELRIERLNGQFSGIERSDRLDMLTETAQMLMEMGFCARIVHTNHPSRIVEKFYADPHYWEDDKEMS